MTKLSKDYRKFNDSVDIYPDSVKPVIYILGLVAELGEYCNKYKKIFRDKGGQMSKKQLEDLKFEAGDIEWYFERLTKSLNSNIDEIIKLNMKKLKSRKKRGKIGGSGDKR